MTQRTNDRLAERRVEHDQRLGSLERGFVDLREAVATGMRDIGSEMKGLGAKLEKRSQPQWQLYLSALAVVITVLGLVGVSWKAPIETSIAEMKAAAALAQTRLDAEMRVIQLQIVPRGEHQEHWRRDERDIERLEKRFERLDRPDRH